MALDVRRLRPDETAVLERVADEMVDHPIVPAAAAEFLRDPRHHLAVAMDDGVVVGCASAVLYVHPDKARPELWIHEVGAASHRRRGIGRRLMDVLFETGRAADCSEAWVLTEESNHAARGLYAAAGRRAEGCQVMFTFPLDGRPGEVRPVPPDAS
jgi:aminoglycoside 6'-N-acetyltransferase I